ncbi:anti-sigma factor [Paracoccus sediminicola]|uniref:anti-sigma factor n=1 Tax=Paracoccus sediminicola TaxID=3017783 RepID=UPI0022F11CDE|nr:anti-sigma factor [Paracoccus sediminicola]WBU58067.1 anti-sigma factor [Paracoccus sediminicola]
MIDGNPKLDPRDIATAGEYVLGTLPLAEREAFRLRLLDEPTLAEEVARWESHLDPLADEVRPMAPREQIWQGVETRLFGKAVALPARAGAALWRWIAIGAVGATLALASVLWLGMPRQPDGAGEMWVSDMVSEDSEVRLTALYNDENGEMRVSMDGRAPGEGRDYELWLIQGDRAPISLGVMPRGGQAAMPVPEELRTLVANATMAITDEPAGGAPGGVATGPVVAQAAMRRI